MALQEMPHDERWKEGQTYMPKQILECPMCGAEIEFAPEEKLKFCGECGALLELDADAEFRDGSWHDLSKVIVHKQQEAEL
jgi:hypothetical protein